MKSSPLISAKSQEKFGKIEDNCLLFNGTYYKIIYVSKTHLICDTNKLPYGRAGDEFPLEYIK